MRYDYNKADVRAKARASAVFLGEPAASEMLAALDVIDRMEAERDAATAERDAATAERDAILTRLDERAAWLIDECRKGGTCYEERDQAIYSAKIAREAMMAVRKEAAPGEYPDEPHDCTCESEGNHYEQPVGAALKPGGGHLL